MEHEYRTVTGSELREARTAAGATVRAIAEAMGCNTATVWRWERPDKEHGQIQSERYMAALARVVGDQA